MYEFGEELIIESSKVPWLIWIQLLIMILLVILLLCGFTLFSSDVSYQSTTAASPSSSSSQSQLNNSRLNNNNINASLRNTTQVEEIQNIKGNAGASTSGEITTEQIQEREGSSTKDSISLRPFQLSEHPCHYLGLAKQAFLKCLGLDPSESATDKRRHLKKD